MCCYKTCSRINNVKLHQGAGPMLLGATAVFSIADILMPRLNGCVKLFSVIPFLPTVLERIKLFLPRL